MSSSPDPIEEWRVVSERAARATGYRSRPVVVARPARGFGLGAVLLVVAVVAGGLLLRPGSGPGGDAPVVASTDDGMFRLTLTTPHSFYEPSDAIEPVTTLTYLGPDPSTGISHGDPAISFAIEEVGGSRAMGGLVNDICQSTPLKKDEPIRTPFEKGGTTDRGFDASWYQDPVLRLPVGSWRIRATLDAFIGSCGGERHKLTVENVIRVGDGPAASPPPSGPAATVSPRLAPTPSPTLSAEAVAARELVRKYVDGLMTAHTDQSWLMLSDWSKRTVGAFVTFSDAERRLIANDPRPPVVVDPTRDPDMLAAVMTGPRADDIAANADPDRAWVVVLQRPESAVATAGNQRLIVAPVDGVNRIWLDTTAETYGAWPYPDGCPAFAMSVRRCRAVVEQAAEDARIDAATASAIWLLVEPGCGGDPTKELVLCMRSLSFVAGVRFDWPGRDPVRRDVFCGFGPPRLVCSENPGIQAVDMHNGYWDTPCTGEAPAGCATPVVPPTGAAARGARALRLATVDVPVGDVGHHEVEIGTAVLPGGVLSEGRMSIDQVQDGFLLDPGLVTMVIRSTDPSRPTFQNIHERGVWDQPETVRVLVVFDVTATSAGATIHITGVEVR